MKSTGIVRRTDNLGRIVIPKELRRGMGIGEGDPLEIFVDGEQIVLKKYESRHACMITGDISPKNLSLANGKVVLNPEGAEILLKELEKHLQKA
ncbi:AbrB/MazE/SpoVT family DNA-binding domain-containing protein [Metabacillus sp. HB246100]